MNKELVLVSFIVLVYRYKPLLFFTKEGAIREFGVGYTKDGDKKTPVPFFMFVILAVLFVKKGIRK